MPNHYRRLRRPMTTEAWIDRIRHWQGEVVVVDCRSPFVVVGTLRSATAEYIDLVDADMHDLRDTSTNRELYLVKTARYGVEPNRAQLMIRMAEVVGISRLADVAVE